MTRPVFRFAPSPNGELHLGHAYSALLNSDMADKAGGRLLLRIEDIDAARSRRAYEEAILRDLEWLGVKWERPVRRQSEHMADYAEALLRLRRDELVYPAFMGRSEVRAIVSEAEAQGRAWPRDPDGAPHYPDRDRTIPQKERRKRLDAGYAHAWRLDTAAALAQASGVIEFTETGEGPDGDTGRIRLDPRVWGDPILARFDTPTSYHLSVTVDDALQGVTHVVRGRDLFHATSIHRLLQVVLGLPEPAYHHHRLILGPDGRKLSKSFGDVGLREVREAGYTPTEVRRLIGL
ncbi:MAG: tRNA glutamyl-Q(34) synthetase GluQRS [Rhizobiaceae bacterium]|nr:tRNA glutamyl-Q(34) synthetase GluQRS [Rhizobiaceae bacterium]MCV0407684.1 tRNA glutamyl-Q(34) synthetase GluQRS [Rhizobiaceae bacterium]